MSFILLTNLLKTYMLGFFLSFCHAYRKLKFTNIHLFVVILQMLNKEIHAKETKLISQSRLYMYFLKSLYT